MVEFRWCPDTWVDGFSIFNVLSTTKVKLGPNSNQSQVKVQFTVTLLTKIGATGGGARKREKTGKIHIN